MTMRKKGYNDYKISKKEAVEILNYCSSNDADYGIIMLCANESNKSIADQLFKSATERKSYERLGYVPITKNDFYAYRRKMVFLLKEKLKGKYEFGIKYNCLDCKHSYIEDLDYMICCKLKNHDPEIDIKCNKTFICNDFEKMKNRKS